MKLCNYTNFGALFSTVDVHVCFFAYIKIFEIAKCVCYISFVNRLIVLVKVFHITVLLYSWKRHRLDASCGFYHLHASFSSSYNKPVGFIKLNRVCDNQTCCNLIFADLL